ncbi:ATP-binding protein [Vibrio cholerae]
MKLTLIRGLPGSGKSTLAKTLPAVHLEADMYFIADDGVYRYDKAKISDAHEWCRAKVQRALTNKQDVVVSNTFVQRWEIAPYYRLAKQFGAEFVVMECTGQFQNIHGVERSTIEHMKKRWQTWQSDRPLLK